MWPIFFFFCSKPPELIWTKLHDMIKLHLAQRSNDHVAAASFWKQVVRETRSCNHNIKLIIRVTA